MDRSHIVTRPGEIATLRRERFTRPKPASGAAGSTFVLAVVEGPDTGLIITLDASGPRALLGQSPVCSLRLTDPEVSRRHASLAVTSTHLQLIELGSTNGTTVNGVSVKEASLHGGEAIRVGSTVIKVQREAPRFVELAQASSFGRVIGESSAMKKLYPVLASLAASDQPVLLEGEAGTGKELVAEELHLASRRKDAPFLTLDASALPTQELGGRLFGTDTETGLLEQAKGGVLFVNEIGNLPRDVQARLRAELTGGADVRIIAGTRRDLDRDVASGRFADDLFFLLAGGRVELPPVREREGDVAIARQALLDRARGDRRRHLRRAAPGGLPPALRALPVAGQRARAEGGRRRAQDARRARSGVPLRRGEGQRPRFPQRRHRGRPSVPQRARARREGVRAPLRRARARASRRQRHQGRARERRRTPLLPADQGEAQVKRVLLVAALALSACAAPASYDGLAGGTKEDASVTAPRPISPISVSLIASSRPRLRWDLGAGATATTASLTGAVVELSRTRDFAGDVKRFTAKGIELVVPEDLEPGIWFWRLKGEAAGSLGTTPSAVWEMLVRGPAAHGSSDMPTRSMVDMNGDGEPDLLVGAVSDDGAPPPDGEPVPGTAANPGAPPASAARPAHSSSTAATASAASWRAPRDWLGGYPSKYVGPMSIGGGTDINGDGRPTSSSPASRASRTTARSTSTSNVCVRRSDKPEAMFDLVEGGPIYTVVASAALPNVREGADINGDGYGDAVVGFVDTGLVVLGTTLKGSPALVNVDPGLDADPGPNARSRIAMGSFDANGDGLADVAFGVSIPYQPTARAAVSLGDRIGRVGEPTMIDAADSRVATAFAAGDFDGDGIDDVALTTAVDQGSRICIWFGDRAKVLRPGPCVDDAPPVTRTSARASPRPTSRATASTSSSRRPAPATSTASASCASAATEPRPRRPSASRASASGSPRSGRAVRARPAGPRSPPTAPASASSRAASSARR